MQMQNYTKIKELQEKMKEALSQSAVDISYDNSQSHIDAENLQAAIDKLAIADMDIMTSVDRLALSNDRIDAAKVDWESNSLLGAKNLIPYPYFETSKTSNNVTFTVNEDGSVTVSTTNAGASARTYIFLSLDNVSFEPNTKYKINGAPNGTSSSYSTGYCWYVYFPNGDIYYNDTEFTTPSTIPSSTSVVINVAQGTVITTPITFKPMLRLATDTDDTYKPYAMTNREATEHILKLSEVKCTKTTAGDYSLKATVDSDGNVTYTWNSIS